MKTQISREGFRADKRYAGVYQQQGRMIIDRDWNELVDILKSRVDEALIDVIGIGSPKGGEVTIQMAGGAPRLLPGRVYAGGLAGYVESVPDVSWPYGLNQQKGFPSAPPLPPAGTAYKIYADLWERPVVSLEDKDLRDPALHGADTCTRTQVMAQIKTCAVALDPRSLPSSGHGLLTLRFPAAGGQLGSDPCDPKVAEVDPVGGDFLFRLEVHDVRWPAGGDPDLPERVVVKWSRENGAEQYEFEEAPDWFAAGPWIYELYTVESEQHLGYHVPVLANNQSWEPKRGTLAATMPPTASKGTLVRRWDGYLVFVQSGGLWSVSSAEGETPDVTAPGATVTFETATHGEITRAVARVGLSDLEFLLEVDGAVFVPGDYWSAPVRRAHYQAGGELLKEAFPSGIYHRYVPLAEVQANGQLRALTAAEQRRLAFPRLTDLEAADMGYTTSCGSGLFNASHDTVKKALDRLCEIGAQHVSYTMPDDTSVYEGKNPQTVAQALDLLADVRAEQIAYKPEQFPAIEEVRSALDELFGRSSSGGNYVTVGNGGQFQTIELALEALEEETSDIALALMPGDHDLGGISIGSKGKSLHLSIVGLGGASRLHLNALSDTSVSGLASFRLERVHLISQNKTLDVSGCHEAILADNVLESSNLEGKHLIHVAQNDRLVIRGNHIDVQWAAQDPFFENILQLEQFENLRDLFSVSLTEFRQRVQILTQAILSSSQREAIGRGILDRAEDNTGVPKPIRDACRPIGQAILDDGGKVARRFEDLRYLLYIRNPGTGVVIGPLNGPTIVEGNQGTGLIGLLGRPGSVTHFPNGFYAAAQAGRFPFQSASYSLEIRNNMLAGVRAGETLVTDLTTAINTGASRPIPFWYEHIDVAGNVFDQGDNHFIAPEVTLTGNNFRVRNSSVAGWTIGTAGLYTSNRTNNSGSRLNNGIAPAQIVESANLRLAVRSVP